MKKTIEEFGAQLRKALEIASATTLQQAENTLQHVVLAGDGTAKSSAELVAAVIQDELKLPLHVIDNESLPGYVGVNTLFVSCSFASEADRSKSLTEQARARGANVVIISAATQLQSFASTHGLNLIALPADMEYTGASIGYMFVPVLSVLHSFGLISDSYQHRVEAAVLLLQQEIKEIHDRAKTLAFNFSSHLPVIYADSRLEALAVRAQHQVNENAKHICYSNTLQKLAYHEVKGWANPASILRNTLVVMIRTKFDSPQAKDLVDIARPVLEKQAAMVMELTAKGNSLLEQVLYMIHLFDWTSLYLAELNDVHLSK